MTHDWQNDPRVLEALFRHLMSRPKLLRQPDRRSGLDRRGVPRGGRRAEDPAPEQPPAGRGPSGVQ